MDNIAQLEDAFDTLFKVMASAVAYLSRKAGHKQVNATVPVTLLGNTEALDNAVLQASRDELVQDLIVQAKDVEMRIQALPAGSSDDLSQILGARLTDWEERMKEANRDYQEALDEAHTLLAELDALSGLDADNASVMNPGDASLFSGNGMPSKSWASAELPDMFLSNLFANVNEAWTDDTHTDLSGSATNSGSDTDGSPRQYLDFMLAHDSEVGSPSDDAAVLFPAGDLTGVHKPDAPTMHGMNGALETTSTGSLEPFFPSMVPFMECPAEDSVAQGNTADAGSQDAGSSVMRQPAELPMARASTVHPSAVALAPEPQPTARTAMDAMFTPIFSLAQETGRTVAPEPEAKPIIIPTPPAEARALNEHAAPACEVSTSGADGNANGLPQSLCFKAGSNADAFAALAELRSKVVPSFAETTHSNGKTTSQQTSRALARRTHASPGTRSASPERTEGATQSKKLAHNAIERRYRSNINDRIAGLRDVIPALREMQPRSGKRRRRRGKGQDEQMVDGITAATKMSKATVLMKATEYICYLKSRETQLAREVQGFESVLCSLKGGDELLAAWRVEMQRVHDATPSPIVCPVHADDLEENDPVSDDDDEDESTSMPSPDSAQGRGKTPRYVLGAFLGFSFFGRIVDRGHVQSPDFSRAATHARVLGAGHQMLKRSAAMSVTEAHQFDHVPLHVLAVELLQTAVLAVCVLVLVSMLLPAFRTWVHRKTLIQPRSTRGTPVQDSPVARALTATPVSFADAESEYKRLQTLVATPRSAGILLSLAFQACARIVRRPRAADARDAACLRRVELELMFGAELHVSLMQRVHSAMALECSALDGQQDAGAQAVLGLALLRLAEQVPMARAWLGARAHAWWRRARAEQLDAQEERSALADILSLPMATAAAYAASGEEGADHAEMHPLSRILHVLRTGELTSFWSYMLASAMRATQSSPDPSPREALRPAPFDLAADVAGAREMQRRLARMVTTRPLRSAVAAEQMLVAFGTLALVTGHVSAAKRQADALAGTAQPGASRECVSRSARLFVALVRGEQKSAADARAHGESCSTASPIDLIACAVLEWLLLQRQCTRLSGTKSSASLAMHTRATELIVSLHETASAAVWAFMWPPPKGVTPSPLSPAPTRGMLVDTIARALRGLVPMRTAAPAPARSAEPALLIALDTLLDNVSTLRADM
ncbi:hypothetical protein MSPP1_001975 [Malassezia sp. CBS 17886]|nr:hypothetical protein MSPP1_001975 [Malassezia sp. CBS 17886]